MNKWFKTSLLGLLLAMAGVGLWAADPVTLSFETYDRAAPGFVATDNWQTRYMSEQALKELNIKLEFVAVPRFQEGDKLNLMMAAGQAPDICMTYGENLVTNYIKAKGLVDLTKLLDSYGPDLKKYLGPEVLKFGNWGGKQWAIPAKRVFAGAYSGFIRKDWLDTLKLKVPTTTDELYTVLKAFRDKDPGKVGKDKIIPMAITVDNGNIAWTSNLIWEAFRKFKGVSESVNVSSERWNIPGHKDAVKYLNKLYNEKLLSPNFVLDKDGQQYVKDVVQGLVGVSFHNWDNMYRANPGMATELAKNVPGGKYIPFELKNNETGTYSKWMYNPNGLFIIVPKTSEKKAEAVIRFLNWMAKPEVLFMLQNGKEGVQFEKTNKAGIPINFYPQDKLADADKWHAIDFTPISNGKEYGSLDKNLEALALGYSGFEAEAKAAAAIAVHDAYVGFRFDDLLVNEPKYRTSLNTKGAELFVKSVTAKPADFNKVFDSLLKEYMASGGSLIEQEKALAYKMQMAETAANK